MDMLMHENIYEVARGNRVRVEKVVADGRVMKVYVSGVVNDDYVGQLRRYYDVSVGFVDETGYVLHIR